ncbi:MAG: hypothetical protein KDI38_01870 [Calditrichaeota bacterium]|nr:hypothetical protein [Calditrichota bacterium]MCB0294384.1 hypothetical protein [Calditrichota bacterium]MCB0302509.1 hypothetical protein [Calditrichota bacterium]MCB0313513.1 hypothetical protein [Calditrichota bacterium]MCB9087841.1 hypothetical protein [Calditrichia bacterium]
MNKGIWAKKYCSLSGRSAKNFALREKPGLTACARHSSEKQTRLKKKTFLFTVRKIEMIAGRQVDGYSGSFQITACQKKPCDNL